MSVPRLCVRKSLIITETDSSHSGSTFSTLTVVNWRLLPFELFTSVNKRWFKAGSLSEDQSQDDSDYNNEEQDRDDT